MPDPGKAEPIQKSQRAKPEAPFTRLCLALRVLGRQFGPVLGFPVPRFRHASAGLPNSLPSPGKRRPTGRPGFR